MLVARCPPFRYINSKKFRFQVDKERRRGRLKRVCLPPLSTNNPKDFRNRVGVGAGVGGDIQRESTFDLDDQDIGRYRTSSQELKDMVRAYPLITSGSLR